MAENRVLNFFHILHVSNVLVFNCTWVYFFVSYVEANECSYKNSIKPDPSCVLTISACCFPCFQKYAMQQALKTMMGQMNGQNSQFSNTAFSPGPGSPFPFPFPPPPVSGPASSSPPPPTASSSSTPSASFASQPVTVDVSATKVEEPPTVNVKNDKEAEKEPKKNGT